MLFAHTELSFSKTNLLIKAILFLQKCLNTHRKKSTEDAHKEGWEIQLVGENENGISRVPDPPNFLRGVGMQDYSNT